MLRVYENAMRVVAGVSQALDQIGRRDADLARQLRRAVASVPLNISEGSYNYGLNRKARYATAMGSMRETLACLETARALGYVETIDEALRRDIDAVIGVLWRNTH